jgi:hypothetical protein
LVREADNSAFAQIVACQTRQQANIPSAQACLTGTRP